MLAVLQQFILQIGAVVRRELELNDKKQIEGSAASLQQLFESYLTTQDTDLLPQLLFKANDLTNQALVVGILTVGAFAVAGSLELAIREERYKHKRDARYKKDVINRANQLVKQSDDFHSDLMQEVSSRWGPVFPAQFPALGSYYYEDHGRKMGGYDFVQGINQGWSQASAVANRQAEVDQEFARQEKEVLYPLYAVVDQWKKIAAMRTS